MLLVVIVFSSAILTYLRYSNTQHVIEVCKILKKNIYFLFTLVNMLSIS